MTEREATQPIVEQWEATLDFFVIVRGTVEIVIDGEPVRVLGPGEFFGELAAIDWGSGFGYPRTASVAALTSATLLCFPNGSLNELLRDHPGIARKIRGVAAERLGASGA